MIKERKIYVLLLLLLAFACRKPYTPQVIETDYSYLVINGVINVGSNTQTIIQLSRTQKITDTAISKPENGASVSIEAQGGGSFPLAAGGNGNYTSAPLSLNPNAQYRLRITTSNGDVYSSDYVAVKQTPPIDSVTWRQDSLDKAVTIYAHAHDPSNKTQYYRWDHVETWQYHSRYEAEWGLVNNGRTIVFLDRTEHMYNCWGTILSSNIAIANSAGLNQDVISYAPVQKIEVNDEKMFVRYSINVKQYGLTKEAYEYWAILEKSSQQTGSIFDPQPSQVRGNFHCENVPDKIVLGYASAAAVTEKRLFIDFKELTYWKTLPVPDPNCDIKTIEKDPVDFTRFNYSDTTWGPYFFAGMTGLVIVKKDCIDCRRRGGTSTKPAFWQ